MMRLSGFSLALAACLFACAAFAPQRSGAAQAALSGDSLYNLDSPWRDQDGKTLKLVDLRGKKLVVAMGYTGCPDLCPLITANMAAIEKAAKAKGLGNIGFAFVTLDPQADTPERLKAYADAHGLDAPDWVLLTGDDKAVRDLAAALGVRYRRNGEGGLDHSAVVTVLDENGEIVLQKPDVQVDPEEFLGHIPR